MVIISYLESIFERVEYQISVPTKQNILDWLRKDRSGTYVRPETSGLNRLATELERPYIVRRNLEEAKNYENLRVAREEIDDVQINTQISELDNFADTRKSFIDTKLSEARARSFREAVEERQRQAYELTSEDIFRARIYSKSELARRYNLTPEQSNELGDIFGLD